MEIDKTSQHDLNVFHPEEEFSIFHRLNFTRTSEGKEWMKQLFQEPFSTTRNIEQTRKPGYDEDDMEGFEIKIHL